jgi:Acetyltransferase (GNAT) family
MTPSSGSPCRVLTPADLPLLTKFDPSRIDPLAASLELGTPRYYTWMGLFSDDNLIAVHRSMRWGPYLLLKGLIVAPQHRGSTAGLRLAIALMEYAKSIGYAGIVVWVEPSKPEREIAARLRINLRGPLVHRIEIPLPEEAGSRRLGSMQPIRAGTMSIEPRGIPMVPDLITPPCKRYSDLHWVYDNGRIVLSGNPCGSVADFPDLVFKIMPIAQSVGATALELPIMACDLESMFSIVSTGARRLSRTAVCLGLREFESSLESSASVTAMDLKDTADARRD